MKVYIVDVETTGFDPTVDVMLEVGVITYSVDYQTILEQRSRLLHHKHCDNKAERVNGISSKLIMDSSEFQGLSLPRFAELDGIEEHRDNILIAHGADFEQKWLGSGNWVCTMRDFEWPEGVKAGGSCVDLAVSHKVPVFSAHRALDDCRLIAEVFRTYDVSDLKSMICEAQKPRRDFQAMVDFVDKDLAKAAGFYWDGAKRAWLRRLQVEKAERGGYGFPFPVKVVGLADRG